MKRHSISWIAGWLLVTCPFVVQAEEPIYLVLTMLKGGTHRIEYVLSQISEHKPVAQVLPTVPFETLDKNVVWITYITHDSQQQIEQLGDKIKVLLFLRDPRDLIISGIEWYWRSLKPESSSLSLPDLLASVNENASFTPSPTTLQLFQSWFPIPFSYLKNITLEEQIDLMLIHTQVTTPSSSVRDAARLIQKPDVWVCYYEDLVTPEEGVNLATRLTTLSRLSLYLDEPLSEKKAITIARHDPEPFKRQVGFWKEYFSPLNNVFFNQLLGEECLQLGYPLME